MTGSVLGFAAVFETQVEDDLCSPVVVGLLILARADGGRIEETDEMLPVALGGLPYNDTGRAVDLTVGNRLGDSPLVWGGFVSVGRVLHCTTSASGRPYLLDPLSAGLRRDRVREGNADILDGCLLDGMRSSSVPRWGRHGDFQGSHDTSHGRQPICTVFVLYK